MFRFSEKLNIVDLRCVHIYCFWVLLSDTGNMRVSGVFFRRHAQNVNRRAIIRTTALSSRPPYVYKYAVSQLRNQTGKHSGTLCVKSPCHTNNWCSVFFWVMHDQSDVFPLDRCINSRPSGAIDELSLYTSHRVSHGRMAGSRLRICSSVSVCVCICLPAC